MLRLLDSAIQSERKASVKILSCVGIGKTVGKVARKSVNAEIVQKATALVEKWRRDAVAEKAKK